MSLTRVTSFAASLDGFATAEGRTLDAPFGHAGTRLVDTFLGTRLFGEMTGTGAGERGLDDALARAGWDGFVGAGSWGAARSARRPARGRTSSGAAGGASGPRPATPCSRSPTTPARRSGWRAARRSASSTHRPAPPRSRPGRRPTGATCAWGECASCARSSPATWWTTCT